MKSGNALLIFAGVPVTLVVFALVSGSATETDHDFLNSLQQVLIAVALSSIVLTIFLEYRRRRDGKG